MSTQKIGITSGSISMTNRTADKLIDQASGDGALLFLYLLRHNGYYDPYAAGKSLHWDGERVTRTFAELENLELVKGVEVEKSPTVSAADAPEYTSEMIAEELESSTSHFPSLLNEVERKLGNKLSYQNLRILMELYDYLALPPEVIYLLVSYMVEETAYRKGAGIRPKMWEIKREGYRWAAKGLDSLDTATAYVEKMSYFRSQEGQVLAIVGITGRRATDKERTYINSWLEMGFGEEAIHLAYEKTLFNIRVWKWTYCNGILKNWHQKNLHTVEEIVAAERSASVSSSRKQSSPPAGNAQAAADTQAEDLLWLQEYMKKRGQAPAN